MEEEEGDHTKGQRVQTVPKQQLKTVPAIPTPPSPASSTVHCPVLTTGLGDSEKQEQRTRAADAFQEKSWKHVCDFSGQLAAP